MAMSGFSPSLQVSLFILEIFLTLSDSIKIILFYRIRPQITREIIEQCKLCVQHLPPNQIVLSKDKGFTFDHVFEPHKTQKEVFDAAVKDVVDKCFEGYNATVLAYGQTGSGKTYTMGTFYNSSEPSENGIISRSLELLFARLRTTRGDDTRKYSQPKETEAHANDHFEMSVQFLELYNDEIVDLLNTIKPNGLNTSSTSQSSKKGMNQSFNTSVSSGSGLKVQEDVSGNVYVSGLTTKIVNHEDQVLTYLKKGILCRTTGCTVMNSLSSRSHAIFTINAKFKRGSLAYHPSSPTTRTASPTPPKLINGDVQLTEEMQIASESLTENGNGILDPETNEWLSFKLHFVDLAGSERLKRTGATGRRAKESIHINCGLLALGNVISALGDRSKKATHVPYRDSKLTRLLQDSLGGNSQTVMIACVSPSDVDFVETLNTLNYANRAKNIKNKLFVNQFSASNGRDLMSQVIIANLKAELCRLQCQLTELKKSNTANILTDAHSAKSSSEEPSRLDRDFGHVQNGHYENDADACNVDDLIDKLHSARAALEYMINSNSKLYYRLKARKYCTDIKNGVIDKDKRSWYLLNIIKKRIREREICRCKIVELSNLFLRFKRRLCKDTDNLDTTDSSKTGEKLSHDSPAINPSSPKFNLEMIHLVELSLSQLKGLRKCLSKDDLMPCDEDNDEAAINADALCDSIAEAEFRENRTISAASSTSEIIAKNMLAISDPDIHHRSDYEDEEDQISNPASDLASVDDAESVQLLNEIQTGIDEKIHLIRELKRSQVQIKDLKRHYERQLVKMEDKIEQINKQKRETLVNLENDKKEENGEFYHERIKNLNREIQNLKVVKKDHANLVKNLKENQLKLNILESEMLELKQTKIKLLRKIKEGHKTLKDLEAQKEREINRLKKEGACKDKTISNLKAEKVKRDDMLKIKMDELNVLRKLKQNIQAQRSNAVDSKSQSNGPIGSRGRETHSSERALVAPSKSIYRNKASDATWREQLMTLLGSAISRKESEAEMEYWIKKREVLASSLEQLNRHIDDMDHSGINDTDTEYVGERMKDLKLNLEFVQENIDGCQESIMSCQEFDNKNNPSQLPSASSTLDSTLSKCLENRHKARYLVNYLMEMLIEKSCENKKNAKILGELKALRARDESEFRIQKELLLYMLRGFGNESSRGSNGNIEEGRLGNRDDAFGSSCLDAEFGKSVGAISEDVNGLLVPDICPALFMGGATYDNIPALMDDEFPDEFLFYKQGDKSCDKYSSNVSTSFYSAINSSTENASSAIEDSRKARRKIRTSKDLLYSAQAEPATNGYNDSNNGGHDDGQNYELKPPIHQQNGGLPMTKKQPKIRFKDILSLNHGAEMTLQPSITRTANGTASHNENGYGNSHFHQNGLENSIAVNTDGNENDKNFSESDRSIDLITKTRTTEYHKAFPEITDKGQGNDSQNNTSSKSNSKSRFKENSGDFPLALSHCIRLAHEKSVLCLDAADGMLFSGSKDRSAKVWDIATGKCKHSFVSHPNHVTKIAYSPYTNSLLTCSLSFVKIWDLRAKNECLCVLNSTGNKFSFSSENIGGQEILSRSPELSNVTDIKLGGRNQCVLYAASGCSVKIWDLRKLACVNNVPVTSQSSNVTCLSTIPRNIAGKNCDLLLCGTKDHYIKLYEVDIYSSISQEKCVRIPCVTVFNPPHYDGVQSLEFAHNDCDLGGKNSELTFFSLSRDNCLKQWRISKDGTYSFSQLQNPYTSVNPKTNVLNCLRFCRSPLYNPYLLAGCKSGNLQVWNLLNLSDSDRDDCLNSNLSNSSMSHHMKSHTDRINDVHFYGGWDKVNGNTDGDVQANGFSNYCPLVFTASRYVYF
ncbi:unnamed protein product [Gordionus sp. m RMFG-2023]